MINKANGPTPPTEDGAPTGESSVGDTGAALPGGSTGGAPAEDGAEALDSGLLNEVLTGKLTPEQVQAIQGLINKYIDRLDESSPNGKVHVKFPPWWIYAIFILVFMGAYMAFSYLPDEPFISNAKPAKDLTMYITHHVTIAIIVVSSAFIVHSLVSYVLKQYYYFRKYRILTINRIAIFATSALTDGHVKDDILKSLIADFPEPDGDLKTIHEKVLDSVTSVAKAAIKAMGKEGAK